MAVSSLVPAAAGISVSDGNTAGWGKTGENWVLLGRSTANASSYNFTSLGGYKKLKITIARAEVAGASTQFRMQMNSDGAANYSQADARMVANYTNTVYMRWDMQNTYYKLISSTNDGGAIPYITTLIDNADSTVGAKHITLDAINNEADFGGQMIWNKSQGHWTNLSAVTSLSIYVTSGSVNLTGSAGHIEVWGAN